MCFRVYKTIRVTCPVQNIIQFMIHYFQHFYLYGKAVLSSNVHNVYIVFIKSISWKTNVNIKICSVHTYI